jgi:hypothetical protein
MDPLLILETATKAWGIPLDRVRRPQIQQLMQAVQEISEQWGGSKPCVLEANDQDIIPVSNTIALVGTTLFAVLSYLYMRYEPEFYVGEAQTLQAWVREQAPWIEHAPRRQAMCRTWEQTIRQDGRIECNVLANWTLERDTPDTRMRLAYNSAICPFILLAQSVLFFRELRLVFTQGQRTTSQRLDIVMGFEGEQNRAPGSSRVKSLVARYAPRRVYLPEEVRTEKNIRTAVMDMYALFSIYLIQVGFSSLDGDPTVREFLFTYIRQYKHGKQLEEQGLLRHILEALCARRQTGHSRALQRLPSEEQQTLMRYTWPDDRRAFRRYVSKTITGIMISRYHEDGPTTPHELARRRPFYTIALAAKLLGIPRTTLYRNVNMGKIQTKQESLSDESGKQQRVIPEEEFRRLEEQKRQDEQDEDFFQAYEEISRIQRKSRQRQVQRLKKQGNSAEGIRQHFRQKAQRLLQDADT